jgi:uncharacterized SAM-binding protein YcdF (DUF218 family)
LIFLLKKIITPALMPLALGLSAAWVGVFCWWFRSRLKAGKIIATCGIILITVLSFSATARWIIKPLEMCYPALTDTGALVNVKWVVVLGGGQVCEAGLPATVQLGGSSLARLVEGIRIHRELTGSRLLLSGGAVFAPVPESETMAAAARSLGVDADRIFLETASRDTAEQAMMVRSIVKEDETVLVTSAHHMPRAIRLFQQVGLKPIPAPTEYMSKENPGLSPLDFFPRAAELGKVEAALHEYLGLLWSTVKRPS